MWIATISHSLVEQNVSQAANMLVGARQASVSLRIGTNISGSVEQASKIERCTHWGERIHLILENMGFQGNEAGKLSKILKPYLSGEKDIGVIQRTSSLGRMLVEFGHRQKAFGVIYQHQESVSEKVLEDVTSPVNPELRKQAFVEALALASGKMDSYQDPTALQTHSESLIQTLQKGIHSFMGRTMSFVSHINSKVFNFPMASAESPAADSNPCKNGLLSKACMQLLTPEKLEEMENHIDEQIEKAKGKNCIRLLGYVESGKSSFCNYLHSSQCERNHARLSCDSPLAEMKNGDTASTQYMETYLAEDFPNLIKDILIPGSTIVDFPGFLGRGESDLILLVQSIFAVKSMARVDEVAQSIVDIIMIDYNSFLAGRTDLQDLIKTLNLKEEKRNGLIIISKAPRPSALEQGPEIPPNKESLILALKDNGVHPALADTAILYDPLDMDLALNSNRDSGGGSTKVEILKAIAQLQKKEFIQKSKPIDSGALLSTAYIDQQLLQLDGLLRAGFSETHDMTARNELAERFLSFMNAVKYLPLDEKIDQILNSVNVQGIQLESQEKFKFMLETGDTDSFLQHLNKTVLLFQDNALLKGRFNSTALVNFYVHTILDGKINNQLSGSLIFKTIDAHYNSFLSILHKEIEDRTNAIWERLIHTLNECSYSTNEMPRVEELKNINAVVLLRDDPIFDEIKQLTKQLEQIQRNYPSERERILDEYIRTIRDALIVAPFVLWIISNVLHYLKLKKQHPKLENRPSNPTEQQQEIELILQRMQQMELTLQRVPQWELRINALILTNLLIAYTNLSIVEKTWIVGSILYGYNYTAINWLKYLGCIPLLELILGSRMDREACAAAIASV